MRVFVAGASGAIGEPLIAELLKQGHSVVGMTTSEARAKNLEGQGAEAAIVDAFDAAALEAALRRAKAEVIIDELTSLPKEHERYAEVCGGRQEAKDRGRREFISSGDCERCAAVSAAVKWILFEGCPREVWRTSRLRWM